MLCQSAGRSQAVEDFYRNRQIRLVIGNPPGGDYDLGGRLLARYLRRHIPSMPTIVVQNMPGASTFVAANYLYNVAPRDGAVFGSFSRNLVSQAVLGRETLKVDPRQFGCIGASSYPSPVCVATISSQVAKVGQLFHRELIVAGAGPGSSLSIVPTVLNRVLGTKFRVVEGYKGAADAIIALERGEVQGICHTYSLFGTSHAELISSGKLRILLHAEEGFLPEAPDVASVYDYATNDEQKSMMRFIFSNVAFGRPYVAPPGIPADRLAALRTAFETTLKDPELLAEASKSKLDVTYRSAGDLLALIDKLYATPKQVIDRARDLMPAAD
jgi:tripartite-type tricarboxylate transporter receptor subunit TctC